MCTCRPWVSLLIDSIYSRLLQTLHQVHMLVGRKATDHVMNHRKAIYQERHWVISWNWWSQGCIQGMSVQHCGNMEADEAQNLKLDSLGVVWPTQVSNEFYRFNYFGFMIVDLSSLVRLAIITLRLLFLKTI